MGTSLTGLTPATTYDALIKVGDNGPLSATAKVLSDGLGNDSILALSTSKVGISTITPDAELQLGRVFGLNQDINSGYLDCNLKSNSNYIISQYATRIHLDSAIGEIKFSTAPSGSAGNSASLTQRMVIQNGGNVGIGTSNFAFYQYGNFGGSSINLNQAIGNTTDEVGINIGTNQSSINFGSLNTTSSWTNINRIVSTTSATTNNAESGYLEFFTKSGAVSTPSAVRLRVDQDGIKFNGDTAAANALDDYEEGDWTMGIAFGNASVGVTYNFRGATYTKIGRQVTVNGYMVLSSKGSSTGSATITGLPFTVGGATGNYTSASLRLSAVSYTGQFQGNSDISSTTISFNQISEIGTISNMTNSNFENNSAIMVNMTYFV